VFHLLGSPFRDLLAEIHNDDLLGNGHDHKHIVLDQEDRDSFRDLVDEIHGLNGFRRG